MTTNRPVALVTGASSGIGKQSDAEWVSTIANAQADFTRQLADAYTSSARSLLK